MKRRTFVKRTTAGAALAAAATSAAVTGCGAPEKPVASLARGNHPFNGSYSGEHLSRIAFPLGGMGAGMIGLEGAGALSHVSLRHQPAVFNEPLIFNAVYFNDGASSGARLLEGPVPSWKVFGGPDTGRGAPGTSYGLPRFANAGFSTKFPFAKLKLSDKTLPLEVRITGWSPFAPGKPDKSSLPVAGLEFTFSNVSAKKLSAVYSFNSVNFMDPEQHYHYRGKNTGQHVDSAPGGFVLAQDGNEKEPWIEGYFTAQTDDPAVKVNNCWFRGDWWDPLSIAWKNVEDGNVPENPPVPVTDSGPSPGASLFVPFELGPGEKKTVRLMLSWYVPKSEVRAGQDLECCPEQSADHQYYIPWYASRFSNAAAVASYWRDNYDSLRKLSGKFSDCFYDSTLPPEVTEAVAANLTILKSPTVMREAKGKLWCWEGCNDNAGCCAGSCTHVWNYAQAICHLFPSLERSLRHTEFFFSQDESGHQRFRSALPIRCVGHQGHAASDGQLGGIMKIHREWRISGNTRWLKAYWPNVKQSLDYCISTWDPRGRGILEEPHHNTYDIEFWGPDGMCGSFYLGALKAATLMGTELGEDVSRYESLYSKGRKVLEEELYDGEYFFHKIQTEGLDASGELKQKLADSREMPEVLELLRAEGPRYQYGKGCLSDGVLGAWIAEVCGVGEILDPAKVTSHLLAVHKYNFRDDLSDHANPQRPSYAVAGEGGLLLCSWPKGGKLSLPFVYSNEVWTGIEYQVASHLMLLGAVEKGLEIVRAVRARYDGRVRNPFNEYECGHWYARAMASFGLIQGLSGQRYDAVEKVLYLTPSIKGDFRSFISTATGYGTVGVRGGEPFIEVVEGKIEVGRMEYEPA